MNEYKCSKYNVFIELNDCTLIFNSYRGSICRLTKNLANVLKSGALTIEESIIAILYQQGIIVDKECDETNQILQEEQSHLFDDKPDSLTIVIAPTLFCNLHCTYCFENGVLNSSVMTINEADMIVSWIIKKISLYPKVNKLQITWFGGEPLLEIELIEYISRQVINYCTMHNIVYSSYLITNGILLNQENQQRLLQCLVKEVQITIDGTLEYYCAIKGASPTQYHTLMDNLVSAADHFHVSVRINYTKNNSEDIICLLDYLFADLKLKDTIDVYFSPVYDYEHTGYSSDNNISDI